ncbi:MAG: hypothetical protein JST68_27455 [Bacteroidetes bacterium]|nr:hypothetical protein [Bacteroidota bacterium]
MKKWILILVVVLGAATVGVYFFLPTTTTVLRVAALKCNTSGVFGFFQNEKQMAVWWPGHGEPLVYDGDTFRVEHLAYFNTDVRISGAWGNAKSRISVLPGTGNDSTILRWECQVKGSYWRTGEVGDNIEDLLRAAAAFLSDQKNVYVADIREGSTTDSCLAVTRVEQSTYPTTKDMYAQVDRLRAFLQQQGARETGYPMVNVTPVTDSAKFKMMVAIPVDRDMPHKGAFYGTRLVPAKFLIADVKGGEATVRNTIRGMEDYIRDYRRTVMAIPYQSLITDRPSQKDTTKWETRIYCPVF